MADADRAVLLHAWLEARSVARRLPAPVADHGGHRVDTGSVAEISRWVFPHIGDGLVELARTIDAPGYVLKACVPADELRAVLPARWQLQAPSFFMIAEGSPPACRLAAGYSIETDQDGAVTHLRIITDSGDDAARGFGAETPHAFAYDRIETAAAHRRKGLGKAVMAGLHGTRRDLTVPALLVATDDGRALYVTLGWRTMSPYSTAIIVG